MRKGNSTFRTMEAGSVRAGLVLGLIVLSAGCQRMYWYQEGKTFAECKAALADCWTELRKRTDLRYADSYKYRFIENCMQERGYEAVAEKYLPLDIAREDPMVPPDVPWIHVYGVAGALPPSSPSLPAEGAPVESAALRRGTPHSLVSQRAPSRQESTSSGR